MAVDDVGNIINPTIVEGQIHGGIAQGLGQALYEEVIYDEAGQMLTGSFMDYALPKAHNFPRFELDNTVTPSPVNPMGVKGVGEAGTIGSTPPSSTPSSTRSNLSAFATSTCLYAPKTLASDERRSVVMIPNAFDYHAPKTLKKPSACSTNTKTQRSWQADTV